MYLKRLEVKGFKSFAEKIDLDFGKGITAIVGPNGSGKSNVSDSIRWVLGEQSAKTLRGSKMEDIIFAGTENRKALGCAEVSLTLDNSEGKLQMDFSEVTVTRRLYRSGESEYLINKTPCRLKDIVELFMDTGIGRDGYSLIGQGKIDEILSAKSEDRRNVFEEAAGIVKYKTRKLEAEKKLENTRQNLLRVTDIMQELEDQIGPLEEQSKVAKKYLSLREELKELEINFILNNYDSTRAKLDKISKELGELNLSKNEREDVRQKMQSDIENLKLKLKTIEDEYTNMSNSRFQMEKSLETKQGSLKVMEERRENYLKDIERLKKEIADRQSGIENVYLELKKIEAERAAIQEELEKKKAIVDELNESYSVINQNCLNLENGIEDKKSDLIQVLKDISDMNNKINTTSIMVENLKRRKLQLEGDVEIKENEILSIQGEIQKVEGIVEEFNKSIISLEKDISDVNLSIKNLKDNEISLRSQRNACFDRLKTQEARCKTLLYMEKDMEGFTRAVKGIMSSHKNDNGVFGTIGDLIDVPKGFETAIEISLGAAFQNIVVDSEDTAQHLIGYLKKSNLGRATFLPLTTIKPREIRLDSSIQNIKGFLGIAADIVKYDAKFKNAVSNLLGRIVICDTLENARNIARRVDYNYRIVTLEGDVINAGGSFTGGSSNIKNSGIFSRRREIEELKSGIDFENKKLNDIEDKLRNNSHEIEGLNERLIKFQQQRQRAEIDMTTNNNKLKGLLKEYNVLKELKNDMEIELNQIDMDMQRGNEMHVDNSKLLEALEADQKSIESDIEGLQQKYKGYQAEKEELSNKLTSEKVVLAETAKSIEGINNMHRKIAGERDSYQEKIRLHEEEQKEIENKVSEIDIEVETIKKDIELGIKEIEEIRIKIEDLEKDKNNASNDITHSEKGLKDIEEVINGIINSVHKMELSNSKMEMELEISVNKLWDEYELTIPQAEKYKKPIDSMTGANKRVTELKNSIRELGDVNVNSIEEYKKVTERHEFLKIQHEDLGKAEQSLVGIIEEITNSMKKQFKEKFQIIRENFNSTFRELFGGGYADLRLEGDDVLDSGIEIIVQPPGKKLQSLSLLSGGERGLSAIALIFAILKMKPTPFCVLDEIEAALDDANVNRFAKFLTVYSKNTQFIVITHRKGSMAVANELYGVTMEEKGVSKVISVKLEGGTKNGMAG